MSENIRNRVSRYEMYRMDLYKYAKHPEVKGSITVLLSVALVAVFLIFAIQPTLVQIAKLRTELSESQKTLKTLTTKVDSLNQVANIWNEAESKIPYLDTAIPYNPNYRTFNKELVALSNQTGVTLMSSSLGESLVYLQGLSPYLQNQKMESVELPFSLRVGGTYEQLMGFWKQLIATDRIARIDNVVLAPDVVVAKEKAPPLVMSMSGTVFYMADLTILDPILHIKKGQ